MTVAMTFGRGGRELASSVVVNRCSIGGTSWLLVTAELLNYWLVGCLCADKTSVQNNPPPLPPPFYLPSICCLLCKQGKFACSLAKLQLVEAGRIVDWQQAAGPEVG